MIICEIGLNHLGSEPYSNQYVQQLVNTSCDAITYQIREKDFYKNDKFRNSELSHDHYVKIIEHVHKNNKKFGMALADYSMIDVCEDLGVDFYKVLSWDLNNYDFINNLLETKKPVYVSSGMSSIDEIKLFNDYYKNHKYVSNLTLIHTQLSYDVKDVNLKAIEYLKKLFKFPVAFGNHCRDINVLYTAIPFEPSDIFIYVKGDYDVKHPDEGHAIKISDLDMIINSINDMHIALGSEVKIKMENCTDKENLK